MKDEPNVDGFTVIRQPDLSEEWSCYLWGSYQSDIGMMYHPAKDSIPNWFIRWMMNICLGCKWVKHKNVPKE